jgi:cytochrome P450/NADPH-cytochrome P450 reductase
MAENCISLIVALKGCESIEADGHIISIGNGANTNTVRSLAAEKLGLAVGLDNIILETASGIILTEIEKVRLQQVVYISLVEKIKDTIPGPRRLPMVGNLYDMMPDLYVSTSNFTKKAYLNFYLFSYHSAAGWATQFATYGSLVNVCILSTEMVGTNDPAIAELFVKESEFFTKKITNTLKEIKDFAGNGLFTSDTEHDEWQLAHKLLMPAFSPRAIKVNQMTIEKKNTRFNCIFFFILRKGIST